MNKSGKILTVAGILFLAGLIIAALGIGIIYNKVKDNHSTESDYQEYVYESVESGEDITYLGLNFVSENVKVKIGDSDKVVIRYIDRKDNPEIVISEEKGVLTVGIEEKVAHVDSFIYVPDLEKEVENRVNNIGWGERKVSIELPKDMSPEMFIETVSGDISMEDINVSKSFYLNTSSGEVSLCNCVIPTCTGFSTISGNVDMNNVTFDDNLTVVCSSGDVNLQSVSVDGNLSIQTISGDINLNDVENKGTLFVDSSSGEGTYGNVNSQGDANFVSISGNVNINVMEAEGFKVDTSSGEIYADKLLLTGGAYISSISGDAVLNFEMNKEDCSLKTSTNSGDVLSPDFAGGNQLIEIITSSGNINASFK